MIDDKTQRAMKLLVEWRQMKNLCDERTECIGCPYNSKIVCDLISTDEVLQSCANIFTEYLSGVDK